jgi:putative autotransporter adhesin-like protein
MLSRHSLRTLCSATHGALLIFALLGSGCVETFDGNGIREEEQRTLGSFERVTVRGALEVRVTPGPTSVSLSIDANLLPRIRTFLDTNTLIVEVDGGNLGRHLPGPHVLVSLPSLLDAELNGSGLLVAEGFADSEFVSVELAGSGELSWSGDATSLDAVLNGSGTLKLEGTVPDVELYLAGSGELDALALDARRASIELHGSGNVVASVDGRVDATVEGSGNIELYGNVVQGVWEESGGGSVSAP